MTMNAEPFRYLTSLEQVDGLSDCKRAELQKVSARFPFRSTEYYLSLIDWNDPSDPIRRIIIPDLGELDRWGRLDPSDEKAYTIMPGLEHKYNSTALFLVSNTCEGLCRYCFRKRLFMSSRPECLEDIPAAMHYIRRNRQITNVLLTGGDALVVPTPKLAEIIRGLRQIEHVQVIRIGTRVPAFNPYRILNDASLPEMIQRYSTASKRIYIMTHFVHPRELTDVAVRAVDLLQRAGAITANQMPLIRGVNDNPQVLAELLAKLSFIGDVPYYLFQCRPATGNRAYTVPIEEGSEIAQAAMSLVSGLAKRLRYVMSHSTGKIEIIGEIEGRMYFRYHRAADDGDSGQVLVYDSDPSACWIDDYQGVQCERPTDVPYGSYGPE